MMTSVMNGEWANYYTKTDHNNRHLLNTNDQQELQLYQDGENYDHNDQGPQSATITGKE